MMTRLASLPLSPFVWLFAFICALYPVNAWQLELMAVAVSLLFLWSCHRLSLQSKEGFSIPRSPILLTVTLLWALSLLSIFWSGVPWVSIMSFCFMSALPITFLTLSIAPFSQREWRVVAGGLGCIFAVLSVWAMVQIFIMPDMVAGRARHPLADPNSLAGVFNLGCIAALGAMLCASTRRSAVILTILAALIFGGMIATGSRSGVLCFVLGLVVFIPFMMPRVREKIKFVALLIVLSAGLFFVMQLAPRSSQTISGYMTTTVSGLAKNDISTLSPRLRVWEATIDVIKEAPLTGNGIGTFFLYYPEHRQTNESGILTHAHSDPLQFWAEMGIAAPVLFYLMLIFCAVRMMRAQKTPLNWTAFCALMVMIAQSHINLNLYNLSVLFLCGVVMAYWFNQTRRDGEAAILIPAERSKSVQAVLAVLLAAPLVVYWPTIASEHAFNKARTALWAGDMEGFGKHLLQSDRFGFQSNPRVYQLAINVPMAVLEQGKDLPLKKQQELYAQIMSNLDESEKLNPRSAANPYFRGKVQSLVDPSAVAEGTPAPEDYFRQALDLDPSHLGARIALIDLAIGKNDMYEAADIAKQGIQFSYSTETAMAFYMRAQMVFTATGDKYALDDVKNRIKNMDKKLTFSRDMAEKEAVE